MSGPPLDLRPKLVGEPVLRVEDPRLLTGRGRYVDDIDPPNLLHVAFLRSDRPHARILDVDLGKALDVPGLQGVFEAADLAGDYQPILATSKLKGYWPTPLHPLAKDKVRYVGEPVIAVVADSRYAAEDAAGGIAVAYEPLPFAATAEAAAQPGAPLLYEEAGTNAIVVREFGRGDVEAAFAQAAAVVKGRFRLTRKAPMAMEPRSYLAEWDARSQALTLHSSTNIPGVVRDGLAASLGLPGSRLRVVAPDVGGSFGSKGSLYPEEVLVAVLARKLERPVKWTADRMEELSAASQAFDEVIEAELGVDADGALLGLRAEVLGDVGAASVYPWTAALEPVQVISFLPGPYRLANYQARVKGVMTPKPPTGPYRGVGRPPAAFAMERLIDMAAGRLGLDPAEMRRRNLIRDDEFPYRTAPGIIWDACAFQSCLEAALAKADYPALRREQAAARKAGRWVGVGIASYAELTGIGSRIAVAPGMPINTGAETADIVIDATGAVTASFGVSSHGQGLETSLAQVVADELGCSLEDVTVRQGDSALVPMGTGTYASRSAVLAGGAATLAARVVKKKLLKAAAILFEAPEDELDASGGVASRRGSNQSMTIKEIANAVYSQMGRIPYDQREDLTAHETYDPYLGTAAAATHLAMVEIDPETYAARVLRYVVAEDCGRIINPMIVDGQVQGGVVQGIGAALLEEVVHDAQGQVLTASLVDYLVPTAGDAPKVETVHVESRSATLGGFRGMGEGGTIGAPAAVANAVADALSPLGIEIDTLPVTPERIFRLVQAAQQGSSTKGTTR